MSNYHVWYHNIQDPSEMLESGDPELETIQSPMTIETPFWAKIRNSKRILLSGAGGGFDIYQFGNVLVL